MKQVTATLAMVFLGDKILLGKRKKKIGFDDGFYNGFGGRLEEGETVEEATLRELTEESGVVGTEYEKVGVIEFDVWFKGEHTWMTVHIYKITKFEGEPIETDEASPEWFDLDKIPYDKMFPDDIYWLPLVLEGKKVKGVFTLAKDLSVLEHKVDIVENLP